MNKILISIYVLTIEEEYDLFIPINENMKNVLNLIQQTIAELSGGYYIVNQNAFLYNGIDGKIINNNNIVKFSGLKNGSRVLLV